MPKSLRAVERLMEHRRNAVRPVRAMLTALATIVVLNTVLNAPLAAAQAASGQTESASVGPQEQNQSEKAPYALQEVLVTAQKQGEQRLQDVPIPMTVIKAGNLVDNNQLQIQDYYTHFPNFSVAPSPDVGNSQILQIRGITTGEGSTPTVGIVLDDVPIGTATGNTIPDLDPSDLAQIEVLRGPQGTLYGSASMGGLVRYVTIDPSTTQLSGRVQAGVGGVENGASIGYTVRAAANVPISDTLAIRASGYSREDPGYIDNPVLGTHGVNRQKNYGGNVAALWRPSDAFTAKFKVLYQKLNTDGSGNVTVVPGLGKLQQNFIAGVGAFSQDLQFYSLTLDGKVGTFDVTSLTGYNHTQFNNSLDFTYLYGPYSALVFGSAYGGAAILTGDTAGTFTQEVRASTPIGDHLVWQIAGYYSTDSIGSQQNYPGIDQTTGAIGGYLIKATLLNHDQERAVFTNLTVKFTDQFDVQLGGRESWLKGIANYETITGALYPTAINSPYSENKSDAFTYLLTPRYRFTPNLMAYVRLASGFRPGGGVSDPTPTTTCVVIHLPCTYAPDKTKNYEVGMKSNVLNDKLTFDASLYYINWRGIQILLTNPTNGFPYTTNGGNAKSQGAELSVETRPIQGLTISSWVTFSDAVLTQNFPENSSAYGKEGDRLPNSSRRSGNLAIQRDFLLTSNATGFVGGTVSYIGDMYGVFEPTADRQHFGGYTRFDLNAGVNLNSWDINLYVNNLTNKYAAIGGGLGTFPPYSFTYITPRNFGVSVAKNFQ